MKPAVIISLILLLSSFSQIKAQDINTENKNFDKQFKEGKYLSSEYQKIGKKWRTALENAGGYPELTYDTITQDVKYEFIYTFDSLDKNIIYNRILEWMSLRYSNLTSVLDYQDFDLGKIIIKGRNPIKAYSSSKLFYLNTYRFTVVENKLKLEISQLSFDYEFDEYTQGETTFYNYVINHPVKNYYPISNLKPTYWVEKMNILKETDADIKSSVQELEKFIRNINNDYNF